MPQMITLLLFLLLLFVLSLTLLVTSNQVWVPFPTQYYPTNPTVHPRLYISKDIAKLKLLWNDNTLEATQIFKHELSKLMTSTSDWRDGSGWSVAALALATILSGGDQSYANRACNFYINKITDTPGGSYHGIEHFILGYDWLFNAPCFDATKKATYRAAMIAFSNANYNADLSSSWTYHDSDRTMSVTTGHLLAGLAILGEDHTNGVKLMDRGWTAFKYGLTPTVCPTDNWDGEPAFPVAKFFRSVAETGINLPGHDYAFMSDWRKIEPLWFALNELDVIDLEFPELEVWPKNSLQTWIWFIDPTNQYYHPIGDQQDTVSLIDDGGKYVYSYTAMMIDLSERYGYTTEAAWGRYFLDHLGRTPWGASEGDPMLWFIHSYNKSAIRLDLTSTMPRSFVGGFGRYQSTGLAIFRTDWSSSGNANDPKQVTWGAFWGFGAYPVDHIHDIAGSFFVWRQGEYLLTEPLNYGGTEAPCCMWNSLGLKNAALPNGNDAVHSTDGPIVYWPQAPAYLERGRIQENQLQNLDFVYSMINLDYAYNLKPNQWAACTGVCRQPVKAYTRHFAYDGRNIIIILDRLDLNAQTPLKATLRFRSSHPTILPEPLATDSVSMPSQMGHYRTIVKILQGNPICVKPACTTSSPTTARPTSPTLSPSKSPKTSKPSKSPSKAPSKSPKTSRPSTSPKISKPSKSPSRSPSKAPKISKPSKSPSRAPSKAPKMSKPSKAPLTFKPSKSPSTAPSKAPKTFKPSKSPSTAPSKAPKTFKPSKSPSTAPSKAPKTFKPSKSPSRAPSRSPKISKPSKSPSKAPSRSPHKTPSHAPSKAPKTSKPSKTPSHAPSKAPKSTKPSRAPSRSPTRPSKAPKTSKPSKSPSRTPSRTPHKTPSRAPSKAPKTSKPSKSPSRGPSKAPVTLKPTKRPSISAALSTWEVYDEKIIWANVDSGMIPREEFGGQARSTVASSSTHRLVTALQMDKSSVDPLILNGRSTTIISVPSNILFGGCAGDYISGMCLVISNKNKQLFNSSISYVVPEMDGITTPIPFRHIVGDLFGSLCWTVTSNITGPVYPVGSTTSIYHSVSSGNSIWATNTDNTLSFMNDVTVGSAELFTLDIEWGCVP
jgi:hypothetical protein